jgi:membrane protein required for colicin V production
MISLNLNDITSFDVVVLLIFTVFAVRGVMIGFMRQIAAFLALIVSYWLAGKYTGQMAPYVSGFIENRQVVFFVSFGVLFFLSAILCILTGKVLHKVMEISMMSWFNRLLGLLLGGVKFVLVSSILYRAVSSGLSSGNELLKKSISGPYLRHGADFVKQVINDPALRTLFIPKEPAIKADLQFERLPKKEVEGKSL